MLGSDHFHFQILSLLPNHLLLPSFINLRLPNSHFLTLLFQSELFLFLRLLLFSKIYFSLAFLLVSLLEDFTLFFPLSSPLLHHDDLARLLVDFEHLGCLFALFSGSPGRVHLTADKQRLLGDVRLFNLALALRFIILTIIVCIRLTYA